LKPDGVHPGKCTPFPYPTQDQVFETPLFSFYRKSHVPYLVFEISKILQWFNARMDSTRAPSKLILIAVAAN
jgi:hypothetical protein